MLVQLCKYYKQSPEGITTEQLKIYLHECREQRGVSTSFINQTISAIKILKKDVVGLVWDEQIKVKRPRQNHRLPEILSKVQVHQLIKVTYNVKHKAILGVLYSSGIRLSELLNLQVCDIDSGRMVIRINDGKGKKSRDAILAENALKLLRNYYAHTHPKPVKYIFEGGGTPGKPYSASSVRNIIKRAADRAGIKKKIHPHSLRHAFATHMLEQGVNLKLIQRLMGHKSLRSTMVYLHVAAIDPSVKSPFDQP